MAMYTLLQKFPTPTEDQIDECLQGVLQIKLFEWPKYLIKLTKSGIFI